MVQIKFVDDFKDKSAKIKVLGVGGGGGNAINRMIEAGIRNVEFIALNTDVQALKRNKALIKLQIGENLTRGLGVGGDPSKGKHAALESVEQIKEVVMDSDLIFITAGMGGGTGTGGAPVVAQVAKETTNALIIGVVTRPFSFEGNERAKQAEAGIKEMRNYVDSILIIPNDKLLDVAGRETSADEAYRLADDVLRQAIQGISDVITQAGDINVDFADVRKIMTKSGEAIIGIGQAQGENRHIEAAKKALHSPLLENAVIDGAKGILVNFTSSKNILLYEVNEAMQYIRKVVSQEALIKFGQAYDEKIGETLKITVIATGFPTKRNRILSEFTRGRFDRVKKPELEEIEIGAGFKGISDDDIEKPAYLRIKKNILQ